MARVYEIGKKAALVARLKAEDAADPIDPIEHAAAQLLAELRVRGFLIAKEISMLRCQPSGTMPCPLCGQALRYRTAPSDGHFAATCTRKGCINAME